MATSLKTHLSRIAVVTTLVALASGCKFFDLSNPLLPSARLVAQPDPTMVTVEYNLKLSDGTITTTAKEAVIKISSFPRDGTPGVFIHSYSAEYFDQAGKAISPLDLKRVSFGVATYLPPASAQKSSEAAMTLPIYNQQVRLYGKEQAYSFAGGAELNKNLIHTINCRVTLYGEDDNFNQIEVPLNIPIRFDANITS